MRNFLGEQILSPKIPVPDQIFPAPDRTGVTVGNHEKVIRHGGDGVPVTELFHQVHGNGQKGHFQDKRIHHECVGES